MQTTEELISLVKKVKLSTYKNTPILELTAYELIVVAQNSLLNDNISGARQWLAYAFSAKEVNDGIKDFLMLAMIGIERNRIKDVIEDIEDLNEVLAEKMGMDRSTYENTAYNNYAEALDRTSAIVKKRSEAGFFKKIINKIF